MPSDSVFEILDDIDNDLDQILFDIENDFHTLGQVDDEVNSLVDISKNPDRVIGLRQKAFFLLNLQIASRINDVEIGITENRAKHLFDISQLEPIIYSESGFQIEIIPVGVPKVKFPNKNLSNLYFAELHIDLNIFISGQTKIKLLMIQRLGFKINRDYSILPEMLLSPRFTKEGIPYDPFLKTPIKKQVKLRERINTEISIVFKKSIIKLPLFNIGTINIKPKPYTYHFGRNKLVFVCVMA